MRNFGIWFIAISVIAFGWIHMARTPSAAAVDEAQAILRLSHERLNARNIPDPAAWNRDTSASVRIVDDDGVVTGKSTNVPPIHPGHPDIQNWESISAQFVDGVALVTGTMREIEHFPGGTVISRFQRTEVWAKENGRWVAIHVQVTPLQENRAHASTTPSDLNQYVGKYQWATGMVDDITTRGHVLYSALGGPPDPTIFIGPDAVTYPNDLGVATFYRGSSGKVSGYTYRRCDGQTVRVPKIR